MAVFLGRLLQPPPAQDPPPKPHEWRDPGTWHSLLLCTRNHSCLCCKVFAKSCEQHAHSSAGDGPPGQRQERCRLRLARPGRRSAAQLTPASGLVHEPRTGSGTADALMPYSWLVRRAEPADR
jgi:hypothetical protein